MATETGTAKTSHPPSFFASLGHPSCSRWGKTEVECIAEAYVQALAANGDKWDRLTRKQVLKLVPNLHGIAGSLLRGDWCQQWFDMVADQIDSEEGAWGVGGFWNPGRAAMLEKARG